MYTPSGVIGNVGADGYGWSQTAKSLEYAYYLSMDSSQVRPSDSRSRYHGFPLRWRYQIMSEAKTDPYDILYSCWSG